MDDEVNDEREPEDRQQANMAGQPRQRVRSRAWFGTLNNPEEHDVPTSQRMGQLLLAVDCHSYVFQRERGEDGTEHYQVLVIFKNPQEIPLNINKAIHWERARSIAKSINYCTKRDTRLEGPWSFNLVLPQELNVLLASELRPWQKMVVNVLDMAPDTRTINWFYEEQGNMGKTALAKYICTKYKALYVTGKAADIKYAVSNYLKENGNKIDVLVCDYVRSMEDYVSYQALEELKNGIFFSPKYESGMVMYNSPHVVVFANFAPDLAKLSADRWNVLHLRAWEEHRERAAEIAERERVIAEWADAVEAEMLAALV